MFTFRQKLALTHELTYQTARNPNGNEQMILVNKIIRAPCNQWAKYPSTFSFLAQGRLYFPASFAVRWGWIHVTAHWPTNKEWPCSLFTCHSQGSSPYSYKFKFVGSWMWVTNWRRAIWPDPLGVCSQRETNLPVSYLGMGRLAAQASPTSFWLTHPL